MIEHDAVAPRARSRNLVVREVGDALIVFDRSTNVGHNLEAHIAATWRQCDGKTSVREIAEAHSESTGRVVTSDEVWGHLVQLGDLGLLEAEASRPVRPNVLSRRSMLLKTGGAVAAGAALPLITSIPVARADNCSCAQFSCVCDGDCAVYAQRFPNCSKCVSCNTNGSAGNHNCDAGTPTNPCPPGHISSPILNNSPYGPTGPRGPGGFGNNGAPTGGTP